MFWLTPGQNIAAETVVHSVLDLCSFPSRKRFVVVRILLLSEPNPTPMLAVASCFHLVFNSAGVRLVPSPVTVRDSKSSGLRSSFGTNLGFVIGSAIPS